MDLYRVFEMTLENEPSRRKSLDEMQRYYTRIMPQPGRLSRLGNNIAKAAQTLAQRVHGEMPAAPAEPAYRRA